MNFEFDPEQTMLRDMARDFLSKRCPPAHVRAMMTDARGYDERLYRELAELGLLGLPFPEQFGGAGLGAVEQALVLEEFGRAAYPGPYVASVVLAGGTLLAAEDGRQQERYLPGLAAGTTTGSFAFLEDDIGWGPDAIQLEATTSGGGYRLNGVKRFVPFAHVAEFIVVVARESGTTGPTGITLFAVPSDAPGLAIEPNVMLDLDSKVSVLTFNDVELTAEQCIGAPGAGWPVVETVLRRAAVAASAEMLGAARKALEMSVDYAKTREQFGQKIGSFQAIKHRLAEMLEATESAHAAVYYAAWADAANAPDAAFAASVAKATANKSARLVTGEAIQVHGGIGYTWEYDLHLYWKRAKHLEPLYGDTSWHYERALQGVLGGR